MNKYLKWIVDIVIATLIVVLLYFGNAFFGNPLSEYLITGGAENYIEENFQDSDYFVEEVKYDFKTGNYYVQITSPTSADSKFTLYGDFFGKITFSTYDSAVTKKWNTAYRLNDEYWSTVESIFESKDFPYNAPISFGEIIFKESDTEAGDDIPDYAIPTEDLVLDKVYDINDIASHAGSLTVYIYDNDISADHLAEILLDIKEFFDEADVSFYAIDCVLEYPPPLNEDDPWKDGYTEVSDFLYKDIYEDGLIDRVLVSNKKAKDFYAEQDELKSQTMD